LKILQARDQVVESIFQEARSRLNQIVTSPVYKPLISKLILQVLFFSFLFFSFLFFSFLFFSFLFLSLTFH